MFKLFLFEIGFQNTAHWAAEVFRFLGNITFVNIAADSALVFCHNNISKKDIIFLFYYLQYYFTRTPLLNTTIKVDVENAGVLALLAKVHTAIKDGTVTQFNNVQIQFSVLSGYTNGAFEYTTYSANANITISDLGGAAEDVSEFAVEFQLNGTATVVA